MNTNELLKKALQDSGVVGAGGAGFPSYAKLNEKADTVILNCAECEPLLKLHRQVMERYANEIMAALEAVAVSLGANQAIIAIKPSYKKAVEAIKAQIQDFKLIKIGFLPEVYPSGDEVVTIYETTGRVVPAGKLPIEVGVVVYNVETMLNIYNSINYSKGVTDKYVTIAGEVNHPVTLCLPIGMTVAEAISLAGGTKIEDYTLICGGPMTGKIISEYDVITKTTNAILVLPNDQYVVLKRRADLKISVKRAMSACCQCNMCTDMCPRNLLGHPIEPNSFMRSLTTGVTKNVTPYVNTYFCSSCGLCEMYSCFQGLSPRSLIDVMKTELKNQKVAVPAVDEAPPKTSRKRRYVLTSRLTARLGLTKYNKPAPLKDIEYLPKKVKILLSQHIGAPALPVVQKGDMVKKGDMIAKAKEDALSVSIHSSINGIVRELTDRYIIINAE